MNEMIRRNENQFSNIMKTHESSSHNPMIVWKMNETFDELSLRYTERIRICKNMWYPQILNDVHQIIFLNRVQEFSSKKMKLNEMKHCPFRWHDSVHHRRRRTYFPNMELATHHFWECRISEVPLHSRDDTPWFPSSTFSQSSSDLIENAVPYSEDISSMNL